MYKIKYHNIDTFNIQHCMLEVALSLQELSQVRQINIDDCVRVMGMELARYLHKATTPDSLEAEYRQLAPEVVKWAEKILRNESSQH